MRLALAGLAVLAAMAGTAGVANAGDRYYYHSPYPPPVRYVPPPRVYYPPPAYYYAPAPAYVVPQPVPYGYYAPYRPHRHYPRGVATFHFKF
jgi:hypothetical protein